MMFDIKRSNKSYIESAEHFVVVRNGIVYLRIVGQEGNFKIMTATAGEDNNGAPPFENQMALNEAALRVSASLGIEPRVRNDYHDREYVEICNCQYLSDAYRAADILFEKLEDYSSDRSSDGLQSLYAELVIDDSGSDVYLSDGMWLSSDGSVKNLGR
tara:strand:+ start:607 stop:1080 length:474 start_codon:yes stop_codon:yes gene_type:complete